MNAFMREFTEAAREGPRLFFAPVLGAVEAVRNEMRRLGTTADQTRPIDRRTRSGTGADRR